MCKIYTFLLILLKHHESDFRTLFLVFHWRLKIRLNGTTNNFQMCFAHPYMLATSFGMSGKKIRDFHGNYHAVWSKNMWKEKLPLMSKFETQIWNLTSEGDLGSNFLVFHWGPKIGLNGTRNDFAGVFHTFPRVYYVLKKVWKEN